VTTTPNSWAVGVSPLGAPTRRSSCNCRKRSEWLPLYPRGRCMGGPDSSHRHTGTISRPSNPIVTSSRRPTTWTRGSSHSSRRRTIRCNSTPSMMMRRIHPYRRRECNHIYIIRDTTINHIIR
jgi:hypothetical protein